MEEDEWSKIGRCFGLHNLYYTTKIREEYQRLSSRELFFGFDSPGHFLASSSCSDQSGSVRTTEYNVQNVQIMQEPFKKSRYE